MFLFLLNSLIVKRGGYPELTRRTRHPKTPNVRNFLCWSADLLALTRATYLPGGTPDIHQIVLENRGEFEIEMPQCASIQQIQK